MAVARVSPEAPLCLTRASWGGTFGLAAAAPSALEMVAAEEPETQTTVGIVRISGPLAQQADSACGWWDGYEGEDGIVERFTETITAPEVGAVVLIFDSPGGTSAGLEEAVRRMTEVRDAAGKPVLVHVNELCASAAYWIAAALATHGIWGPVAAHAGSIGSYVAHTDYSGMLAIEGIKETLIADPPGKVAGAGSQPLDDLGRARLERDVLACTQRFIDAVAAARGLTPDAVRALDADCLPIDLAVAAGLADGRRSLEDVLSLAATLAATATPNAGATMPMQTLKRPRGAAASQMLTGVLVAAGDPITEPRYAEGARVKISSDGAVGEVQSAQVTDVYEVLVDGEDMPRRCLGDELEAEAPADAGDGGAADGGAAQQRSGLPRAALPRSFAESIAKASGLRRGVSDAAATAKAAEMLGLAAFVMEQTGAMTAAAARGIVAARFRDAAQLATTQKQLDERNAADQSARRLALLEQGVTAGVWTPGKVWKDGDKAKGVSAWASAPHKGPKGEQLGQSLEQLEADLRASAKLSFTGPPAKPSVTASTSLTEDELAAAKRAGASVEDWEAAKASVLAGELPTKRPAKGEGTKR